MTEKGEAMTRLTNRNDEGFAEDEIIYNNPIDPEGMYNILDLAKRVDDGDGTEAEMLLDISNRLAACGDTGLEPEEIARLRNERDALKKALELACDERSFREHPVEEYTRMARKQEARA